MSHLHRSPRLRRIAITLCAVAVSIGAASASADAACPASATSRPFLHWLDLASYTAVPGGSFDPISPAWSLEGASVTSGNESYNVQGGSHSLSIASGGVAVSPAFCVSLEQPTLRFFARHEGGGLAPLHLALRWSDASGAVHSTSVGSIVAGGAWAPSPVMLLDTALPLVQSLFGSFSVQLQFQAEQGAGAWQIDDVYYDPYSR
jgi:hypothetical protein